MMRLVYLLALGLVACTDRQLGDDPAGDDEQNPGELALELCAEHCSRLFSPCAPPEVLYATEDECAQGCMRSSSWGDDCRSVHEEKLECVASLSCSEFATYFSDPDASACAELAWEDSQCE
jgi:hypothetical protein